MTTASRRGLFTAVIGAAAGVAVIAFAVFSVFSFGQQSEVDRKLCLTSVQNRNSTRASWQAVRAVSLAGIEQNQDLSEAEKGAARVRTNAFVDAVLRPIPPLECVDNKPVPKEEQ